MANSLMSSASYTIGYSIPVEYRPVGPDRYVTKITTEEGQTNIDYTSLTPPPSHYIYHNSTVVTVKRGNSFDLNLTALPDQSDGLQWCQAIILVDWNQDYDFADEGERIAIIGKRKANNSATVLNISQNITVPATAELGKTRIRVVYTDSWRPTHYADLGADPVDKGRIYDLDLIVESGTSVNEVSISQLRVFPNPAKDYVNIYFPRSGKYTISLNTLEGKTIDIRNIRMEQEGDYRLNLDSLSTSTMILNIKHESGLENH